MERILIANNILSKVQFGIGKNSTTTIAIIQLVSELLHSFHDKSYSAGQFPDLRQAFDTVDKDILLAKLQVYVVETFAHQLIVICALVISLYSATTKNCLVDNNSWCPSRISLGPTF